MIDIILAFVILGLLGYIGWKDYQDRKERAKLVNFLVAKDNREAVNLTLADQTKVEPAPKERRDIIDTSEATDEEFDQMIAEQNKTDDEETV